MRTKPVTRDEVQFNGERITTMPADSVRKDEDGFPEPIIELWAPLVQSLRVAYPSTSRSTRVCQCCGKKFFRTLRGPDLYCSDRCAERARVARFVRARSEERAEARAGRTCESCGAPLDARRSTMRFCPGSRCRVAAHRAARRPGLRLAAAHCRAHP